MSNHPAPPLPPSSEGWEQVESIYPYSDRLNGTDGDRCYFADSVDAAKATSDRQIEELKAELERQRESEQAVIECVQSWQERAEAAEAHVTQLTAQVEELQQRNDNQYATIQSQSSQWAADREALEHARNVNSDASQTISELRQEHERLKETLNEAVVVARNYYMLFRDDQWKERLDRWRVVLRQQLTEQAPK